VAPPALVFASATAFLLPKLVDLAVYTPLQEKGLTKAVVANNVIGMVVSRVTVLSYRWKSRLHLWLNYWQDVDDVARCHDI
jgi:queuosine precursor transporter